MRWKSWSRALAASVAFFASAWARADEAPPADGAARNFVRGVELAKSGRLDEAVLEFEAAYRASPHYVVLYNLGQTYLALGRSVAAVQHLERYLSEGGSHVDEERRAQVRQSIAQQRQRIGALEIDGSLTGAEVFIDGRIAGTLPLPAPVELVAGEHGVVVTAPGRIPFVEAVRIAGRQTTTITARLEPLPPQRKTSGAVRIRCDVPDVEVRVDGTSRAKTPVVDPLFLSAEAHVLEFHREGYESDRRRIIVSPARLATVSCRLIPSAARHAQMGSLRVKSSVPGATVRVDGAPYRGQRLPDGVHELEVLRSGFVDVRRRVFVTPGRASDVFVTLQPTPEHHRRRAEERKVRARWSIGLGAAGAALAGTGIATYIINSSRYDDWAAKREDVYEDLKSGATPELLRRNAAVTSEATRLQKTDDLALGLAVSGIVAGAIAAFTYWLAPGAE
jgi:hypothetical protein